MDTFNLKEAVEQSLLLLEQSNASTKTLKEYRCTGFGSIIRHFKNQKIVFVNAEMLDAFVLEQRGHFEHGDFSVWKWRLVRRSSELLKCFAKTGDIFTAQIRPWEPVLRKLRQTIEVDIPTPEQLADPDNIFALAWRTNQALKNTYLTKSTVRHYTRAGWILWRANATKAELL